jgi:hypothetical protein
MNEYSPGQAVQHKRKTLHDARFQGITKRGKIAVSHNYAAPYGVHIVIDYYNYANIEPRKEIGR